MNMEKKLEQEVTEQKELEAVTGGGGTDWHPDFKADDICKMDLFKPIDASVANDPRCKNCRAWISSVEGCELDR